MVLKIHTINTYKHLISTPLQKIILAPKLHIPHPTTFQLLTPPLNVVSFSKHVRYTINGDCHIQKKKYTSHKQNSSKNNFIIKRLICRRAFSRLTHTNTLKNRNHLSVYTTYVKKNQNTKTDHNRIYIYI